VRTGDGARHLLHHRLRGGRLDEEHVRAGLPVQLGASDGVFDSRDGDGVGAGDDEELLRLPRVDGCFDLRGELGGVDESFPREVAALLREVLVL
jgi:hypothetical protein